MTVFVEQRFITNDLSLAAYLVMHDMQLVAAKTLGKSYKFEFIPSNEIGKLKMQYVSSESSRFDDAVRKLKKVLFSDNGGGTS